jgi:hypothetical protein
MNVDPAVSKDPDALLMNLDYEDTQYRTEAFLDNIPWNRVSRVTMYHVSQRIKRANVFVDPAVNIVFQNRVDRELQARQLNDGFLLRAPEQAHIMMHMDPVYETRDDI